MADFLRLITPYLYVLIPFIIGVSLVYWGVKSRLPEHKSLLKTIYRFSILIALAIFTFAVLRMASINEVPENQLDNSVKKDRQNEMIERSKEAVDESNN